MTARPDSRLLVKADALPFVPEGVRTMSHCPRCGSVESYPWLPDDYETNDDAKILGSYCSDCNFKAASFKFVDLSAPDQRDGLDVRLDAFPWALRVLHRDAAFVVRENGDEWWLRRFDGTRCEGAFIHADPHVLTGFRLDAIPDRTGLSPKNQYRAIVAAALQARAAVVAALPASGRRG